MNVTNLWITVGCPGSGKSTWLAANARGPIVSRDEVRFSLMKEGDDYFANEKQVFTQYVENIQTLIDNGVLNVYADATHLNERSRNKLLNALRLNNVTINYIVFLTNLDYCLYYNAKREGITRVPETVIKRMYDSFSDPIDDEKYKPFNIIYIDAHGEVCN